MPMNAVALAEWNWSGHHPTFFNHLVTALEQLGVVVLALCPDPAAAAEHAERTRGLNGTTRFAAITLPRARFNGLRPQRLGAIDRAIRHFTGIEKQALCLAAESNVSLDAVFHACVYDRDFEWFHYARPLLHVPWAGLYLHAISYRMPGIPHPGCRRPPQPARIFHGRKCLGAAVLDEGIAAAAAADLRKPVVVFPDPPETGPPAVGAERAPGDGLREFAAGRPVVGLLGHLLKSKGLDAFLEAAALPGAAGLCFALGGEMQWPFDARARRRLRWKIESLPNLWTHFGRIPNEAAFGHLMDACDVLAAAYLDFPHSSGIQAKAAALAKPVVVSDGHLMAERARRFRTGEVVPQGDARALLDAVLRITADRDGWLRRMRPRWKDYLEEHSHARLTKALGCLLQP